MLYHEEVAEDPMFCYPGILRTITTVSRLLNIKSEYRLPEQCYNAFCQFLNDSISEENNMVGSLYESKK